MSTPLPGQHLPRAIDPDALMTRVDDLLSSLDAENPSLPERAAVLEQAHDVLVAALESVDKS